MSQGKLTETNKIEAQNTFKNQIATLSSNIDTLKQSGNSQAVLKSTADLEPALKAHQEAIVALAAKNGKTSETNSFVEEVQAGINATSQTEKNALADLNTNISSSSLSIIASQKIDDAEKNIEQARIALGISLPASMHASDTVSVKGMPSIFSADPTTSMPASPLSKSLPPAAALSDRAPMTSKENAEAKWRLAVEALAKAKSDNDSKSFADALKYSQDAFKLAQEIKIGNDLEKNVLKNSTEVKSDSSINSDSSFNDTSAKVETDVFTEESIDLGNDTESADTSKISPIESTSLDIEKNLSESATVQSAIQ